MEKLSFEEFCADAQLLNEPISKPWSIAYRALDGLPISKDELPLWREMSGLDVYEPRARHQLCVVKGRRSQGTKSALKYLVYKAHTENFQRYAPRGERLHIPIILQDRAIASEVMKTLQGFYAQSAILAGEVAEIFRNQVALRNGIVFTVQTCTYRAPRGIPAPLGLCDEVGIWRQTGNDVDTSVIRSLRPAQIQFPNRKLLVLGTPWVRAGYLHEHWENRFADEDCLVLHAPTPTFNTLIPAEELKREETADAANYSREFLGIWSSDLEQFISDTDVTVAVQDWRELPPDESRQYIAALDASGLTGGDKFTFGIANPSSNGGGTVCVLRGWRRASVPQVCDEIAALCAQYRIKKIVADQYSFSFLQELLRERGVELEQLAFSARSKPEIYFALKNLLAQGRLELPKHEEMLRELRCLESLRTSGGNYKIGAPRGQHDDFVTVLALLAHRLVEPSVVQPWVEWIPLDPAAQHDNAEDARREKRANWRNVMN